MKRDNHRSAESPPGRQPRRTNREFQRQLMAARRLAIAARRVWARRYLYEQQLVLQGQEPRFRVSWEKLKQIANNPRVMIGGFGKFIHRLHRLAQSETDEAMRAYHAVSRPRPQPTDTNQPSQEEV